MADYKADKEAFVSGMTGSSVMHINFISAVALSSVALYSALRTRLPPSRCINFSVQWLTLVLPLLLSITLFANTALILSLTLLLPTTVLLFVPRAESGTLLLSSRSSSPAPSSQSGADAPARARLIPPLPALTTYRTHMMLMTVLSILAVDFPVFPRALAKCETYGASLMDLGVGSFVFSQGIVSAIPMLKDPSYLTAPMRPKLLAVTRKSLPVIVIGLVRVLLVKGTEYPEHESEYGTHWNFFITLALLPILQVLLHPFILYLPISLLGSLVALAHQVTLSLMGVSGYVLTAPRTNVFSANKEGIVSLAGYLAIHLLGLSTGTLLLPPSPSFFRRRQQSHIRNATRRRNSNSAADVDDTALLGTGKRQNDKTATELCSYAVVWWTLVGVSRYVGVGTDISRRMVNLPYILWVAAFNTTFLFCYLLLDLAFFPSPLLQSVYSPTSKLKVPVSAGTSSSDINIPDSYQQQGQQGNPPPLFQAINKNGLALFLFANVLTGLVNLTIPTMYTGDIWAMFILCAYTVCVCATAWITREHRIWVI